VIQCKFPPSPPLPSPPSPPLPSPSRPDPSRPSPPLPSPTRPRYLLSLTTNALSVFRCGMSESGSHVIMQYVLQ
jgi:hypothetical protein